MTTIWKQRIGIAPIAALIACFSLLFWLTHSRPSEVANFPQPTSPATTATITSKDVCLDGCPIGTPSTDQIVTHHILILANNPETKFADWVAYRITRDSLGSHCQRHWESDPDINVNDTLEPRDYVGIRKYLGSDRGHQAPLASLCGSPYWQEADYLSNITPQKTDLNEGAWERLENAERSLIEAGDAAVYAVTGPLYERRMLQLPNAHISHTVPSGYWKVIAVVHEGQLWVAAFVMDQNSARDTDYCTTAVTVSEVQRRTHLVFFSKLSKSARGVLDNVSSQRVLVQKLGCP